MWSVYFWLRPNGRAVLSVVNRNYFPFVDFFVSAFQYSSISLRIWRR